MTQGQEVKSRIIIMKTICLHHQLLPEIPGSKSKVENPRQKGCWLELKVVVGGAGRGEHLSQLLRAGLGVAAPRGTASRGSVGTGGHRLQKPQLALMFLEAVLHWNPLLLPSLKLGVDFRTCS